MERSTVRPVSELAALQQQIIGCHLCPRLVRWREKVSREKTRRFVDWEYWGKPIPSFGDPRAQVLLIGLAPAAHGGNRTGRMFTGDRSGDWLFRSLSKAGFANQPLSESPEDGLKLRNCYITAACRCAPPQNKLLPKEIRNCRPFLLQEMHLLRRVRIIVGLGKVRFDAAFSALRELGWAHTGKKPAFSHGAEFAVNDRLTLLGSFHPSQQNTFTGRLTEPMLDSIFQRAQTLLHSS
ncbi:MAG: uracil-DNA glycosylase [Ignavibacteriales bacterium]|nr:uracil-DNA glycosylase [Ignavibacteriales bacterium]